MTKVKIYNLDPQRRIDRSVDRSIRFERENLLYGAVTAAQQMDRAGQYYTIFWKATDRSQPVTVRFEYRQQKTGLEVKSKEVQATEVAGSNISKFDVTSSEFQQNGAVTSWRVTLLRGKEELAHADSFLWQ